MKKLVLIIILMLVVSCQTDNLYLKKIANKNNDAVIVFMHIKKDKKDIEVGVGCNDIFYNLYLNEYSDTYKDFYTFLLNLVNAKIIIKKEKLQGIKKYYVDKSSLIFYEYRTKGIKSILKKYFIQKNNMLILDNKVDFNEIGNFMKIMFDEGYIVTPDDISGETWFYYFKDYK